MPLSFFHKIRPYERTGVEAKPLPARQPEILKALYNLLHACALKRGVFLLGAGVRVFGGCVGVRALRVALIECGQTNSLKKRDILRGI